ncbi:hypothetical protein PSP6_360023 [Paraburkholderia tropica]|nr:hypothetical protein PSP6_360023 [Paraburkholderia tropica]
MHAICAPFTDFHPGDNAFDDPERCKGIANGTWKQSQPGGDTTPLTAHKRQTGNFYNRKKDKKTARRRPDTPFCDCRQPSK